MDTWEWMDPKSGLFSAKHKSQPGFPDLFADTLHHTCIFFMREYISNAISKESLRCKVELIWKSVHINGKVYRYPGSNEEINRDQSQFLVPLLREVGMINEANFVSNKYAGILLPHWRDWFYGKSTWLGRLFEWLDVVADKIHFTETSAVKNIVRCQWWGFKNVDMRRSLSVLNQLKRSPKWILVVYFSRTPEMAAGKSPEEALKIFDELYIHKIGAQNILVTDWPPIYKSFRWRRK
jgi:hypothetical protein